MASPATALLTAVVAGAASAALLVVAVGLPRSPREQIMRTLAAFGSSRTGDRYVASNSLHHRIRTLVGLAAAKLGNVLTSAGTRRRLGRLSDYAGNPSAWPIDRLVRARGLLLVGGAAFGAAFGHVVGGTQGLLLGVPGGAVLGMFLPDLLLYNAGVKRQADLARSLPDVLDALVISVEAGLGLDAAMAQVADNLTGPMPDEIYRALQEMKIGVARTEVLRAMAQRTTVRDLKSLVTALVQSGELGVPVSAVLREHAREQRVRRRQRAEELAQKVPVKLLFPVLFCLFPAIFVVILGPSVLRLIATFSG